MTKHFYNETDQLILDALESISLTGPDVAFDRARKALFLPAHNGASNVAIISGGGAGHEPAHAGFVGDGMLTAAVSGSVFASPSVSQIVGTVSRVAGPAGTVLVIMNYTGDVFHFHLAAEKAKAATGHPVEVLVVGDDVSVGREKSGKVGRRGLAGTVLVNKILGAASRKAGLEELMALGKSVDERLVTVGTSLGHVHIPGRPDPSAAAADQHAELGMGIHNEPGCRVLNPQPQLPALVDMMLDQCLDQTDADRAYVDFSDDEDVVLLVNNLGGISPLEFGGITGSVVNALGRRDIVPSRVLSGTYMSSLDGPGFSITLLKATPEMVEYIDAPTAALGWAPPRNITLGAEVKDEPPVTGTGHAVATATGPVLQLDLPAFKAALSQGCTNVISAEQTITQHDTVVGDGDCGVTLARGARAAQSFLSSARCTPAAVSTLADLIGVVEDNMDGTSGAIYGIFVAALASEVRKLQAAGASAMAGPQWAAAARGALRELQKATPARQGDRTLMDALEPFVEGLGEKGDVTAALAKARAGVAATKGMRGAFGRAVYVDKANWSQVPDPGAEGLLCLLEGLSEL